MGEALDVWGDQVEIVSMSVGCLSPGEVRVALARVTDGGMSDGACPLSL